MIQIRDLLISSKEPDLKNVGWVSFDKNTQKYELKFYINGRWLPIVSNIDTIEPEKIEEVKELIEWINNNGTDFNNSKVNSITWNNDIDPSNMNDFVVAGVYDIKGERTRSNDNLPILNTGGGHSFNARLTVLNSSISGSGRDNDKCITQVLSFSNRLGQGEVYIRTGKGSSLDNITWENWSTLQRNVNVGQVDSLDGFIDNGIYSGVWTKGSYIAYPLTFVCVVINDYFIGTEPRRISQFVYGLSKFDGSTVYQSRVWDNLKNAWGDWEILNQNEISSMISNEINKITDGVDPEKLDSLKDLIAWVDTHAGTVAEIKSAIQANKTAIEVETERASMIENILAEELNRESSIRLDFDNDIKGKSILFGMTAVRPNANNIDIEYKNINQEATGIIRIPSATKETAGIMTAKDKETINSLDSAIAEGEKRALRRLFVAAGAEYNDSGADKTKTAPWGETVTHKAGHYYLNGLGDITEEEMTNIYNSQKNVLYPQAYTQPSGRRTYISDVGQSSFASPIDLSLLCAGNYNLEVFGNKSSPQIYCNGGNLDNGFYNCRKLKHIASERIYVKNARFISTFHNCESLITVKFQRLSNSISFSDSPNISKDSILYLINKAQPTIAITITLHPDAYARLTNDADVVAALEAQPLVTLVSA